MSDVASHKAQLEKLEEEDPEFFDYLKKHDRKLLNFDDSEGDEEEDASEAMEEGDEVCALPCLPPSFWKGHPVGHPAPFVGRRE